MKKRIWIPLVIVLIIFVLIIIGSVNKEPELEEQILEETVETTEYTTFAQEDFTIQSPDWNELNDTHGEERIVGLSKGVCSLIVDKHNALPKDIVNWLEQAIDTNYNLIGSEKEGDIYYITYELPYQDFTVTATTKIFYCNYFSYITQVLCVNEMITEEYESIKDEILDSSYCLQEYEVPTPQVIQEEKEEIIEEEPEVVEEIRESVVKTDIGEQYGIDAELVVYFINNNQFFKNVLKDFPKGNLIAEDDGNIEVRIEVNSAGEIILVEDGLHSDPDVTLIVPLMDVLNILNNADNITPANLIQFAINVRTVPEEIKNEVFERILRGEYN